MLKRKGRRLAALLSALVCMSAVAIPASAKAVSYTHLCYEQRLIAAMKVRRHGTFMIDANATIKI